MSNNIFDKSLESKKSSYKNRNLISKKISFKEALFKRSPISSDSVTVTTKSTLPNELDEVLLSFQGGCWGEGRGNVFYKR